MLYARCFLQLPCSTTGVAIFSLSQYSVRPWLTMEACTSSTDGQGHQKKYAAKVKQVKFRFSHPLALLYHLCTQDPELYLLCLISSEAECNEHSDAQPDAYLLQVVCEIYQSFLGKELQHFTLGRQSVLPCCNFHVEPRTNPEIQTEAWCHSGTWLKQKKMGIATRGPVAICLVIEPWGSHHLSKFGLGEWFALLLPSLVLWHTTRRGHRPCPSCPRCLSAILCLQQAHWCRWNVWDNYKALIIRLYWGLLTSIIPISPDCGVTFSSQWKFGRWVQSIKHLSRLFAISQSKHSLVTLIIEHSCGKSPYVL